MCYVAVYKYIVMVFVNRFLRGKARTGRTDHTDVLQKYSHLCASFIKVIYLNLHVNDTFFTKPN